ncbi:hypothetical protein EVAR_96978_1 [Eumeta japonica]|uniref:Reverse transcriptase domain-containing protein n=1 Tax=Eumeta variegata TaxID=151549 RepID=A0A4C1VG57_EUMVA|nr:hypothetical protein EVAR_96978_1 [Eumeta japonica]
MAYEVSAKAPAIALKSRELFPIPKAKDIFKNLSKICGLSGITVEAPYRRNIPGQCHRCQLCTIHQRVQCTKEVGEKLSCCTCEQSHTVNYGGCPFTPKPRFLHRHSNPKTIALNIKHSQFNATRKVTVTPQETKTSAGGDGFCPMPIPSVNSWIRRKEEQLTTETTKRKSAKLSSPLRTRDPRHPPLNGREMEALAKDLHFNIVTPLTPTYYPNICALQRKVKARMKEVKNENWSDLILDNTYSSMRPIRAGVPQGSTLSLLLYSTYVNDIPRPLIGVQLAHKLFRKFLARESRTHPCAGHGRPIIGFSPPSPPVSHGENYTQKKSRAYLWSANSISEAHTEDRRGAQRGGGGLRVSHQRGFHVNVTPLNLPLRHTPTRGLIDVTVPISSGGVGDAYLKLYTA